MPPRASNGGPSTVGRGVWDVRRDVGCVPTERRRGRGVWLAWGLRLDGTPSLRIHETDSNRENGMDSAAKRDTRMHVWSGRFRLTWASGRSGKNKFPLDSNHFIKYLSTDCNTSRSIRLVRVRFPPRVPSVRSGGCRCFSSFRSAAVLLASVGRACVTRFIVPRQAWTVYSQRLNGGEGVLHGCLGSHVVRFRAAARLFAEQQSVARVACGVAGGAGRG